MLIEICRNFILNFFMIKARLVFSVLAMMIWMSPSITMISKTNKN